MTVEDVKAALGATEEGSRSKVAIQIIAGELPAAADQAEAALRASGAGPIFQRAGQLVHIAERPARRNDGSTDQQQAIVAIDPPALAEQLAKAAGFEKFDVRQKDWRTIDPPVKLIDLYFARSCWRLPDLHQLIGAPTLRTDGSVLVRPGYDPETGLYLLADLLDLTVPDKPSYRQAEAANEALTAMFSSFPLVDEPPGLALGVALAGLVGAVLRPTLPACPLIGVTAPAAGTGKSYLVDLISIIATGRRAAGVATGSKPEEFEKSLGAALLEGRPLLCLDNMVQPLAGQMLCMTLSQERVAVRILGQSRSVEVPSAAGLFATGNNLTIRGDMARRTLLPRCRRGVSRGSRLRQRYPCRSAPPTRRTGFRRADHREMAPDAPQPHPPCRPAVRGVRDLVRTGARPAAGARPPRPGRGAGRDARRRCRGSSPGHHHGPVGGRVRRYVEDLQRGHQGSIGTRLIWRNQEHRIVRGSRRRDGRPVRHDQRA